MVRWVHHWFIWWIASAGVFMAVDSAGRVTLVRSAPWLHPQDQAVEEMLAGWRNQQLSRNLQTATVDQRIRWVRQFLEKVNEYPWRWTPALVEEYFADLKSVHRRAHSTMRAHQGALRHFTGYITSAEYGWLTVCQELFGTHAVQVFFEWNTAAHAEEFEGRPVRRPFTREELQRLFDHADDEVGRAVTEGRKGWQPAFRDSVMLKVAYSFGLRFNELRHLQTVDFAVNPHARQFGKFGICKVRYGKSRKGSPHKPRSVLTVFTWTPEILTDWIANGGGDFDGSLDLFSSERGGLVGESTLLRRLRRYCADLGLPPDGLDLHSLRRSYATHLLEDGWDPRFVQFQMGHEYASTTGIYQFVSDDFRARTLRAALNRTVDDALTPGDGEGDGR